MRIYLDSVILVYLVERVTPHHVTITNRLAAAGTQIVISDLSRMECLVKPTRNKDSALISEFQLAFVAAEKLSLEPAVFDLATQIRADYNFKTPDSLHLAVATHYRCDSFFTNDQNLRRYKGVPIETL